MKKILFILFFVSLSIVSGCTNNKEVEGNVHSLEEEIKVIKTTINNQSLKLQEQDELLKENDLEIEELQNKVTRLENAIDILGNSQYIKSIIQSATNSETGIVENSEFNNEILNLTIRYAEIATDENEQYIGLNESDEIIEISVPKKLPVFLLDRADTMTLQKVEWSDLKTLNLKGLFLNIYREDEEIVLIQEIYIP